MALVDSRMWLHIMQYKRNGRESELRLSMDRVDMNNRMSAYYTVEEGGRRRYRDG